jgi:hypothetical protein
MRNGLETGQAWFDLRITAIQPVKHLFQTVSWSTALINAHQNYMLQSIQIV